MVKGKVLRKVVSGGKVLSKVASQRFSRLTIVWLQQNGNPFDTAGFRARLIRNGQVVAVTQFDRYGVARFSTIDALTRVSYTLQAVDSNGVVFRTRTVPARVEVFGIIG
ncbi:hypothetical protein SY83_00910 [Paenibacillus swuensis]|uniref:Uncharacterized protein n=2 Tax=Paenibacillus swuensis TaxID=1178515 RepID=A0A172TPE4_9BACL|nr:hypothetical protein SY83_00910 [Paenibacillus swuensis]